jgi:apolipoprotein N-acyltransferase
LSRLPREANAALSGVLLALSFPKFGHGVLAWVALCPLLIALHGVGPGRALRLGYVTGAVSALGVLYWTSDVVVQYGGLSRPVGVAVMVLLCVAFAIFPALFGWLVGRWLNAVGPEGLLLSPLAWVGLELLRAHTFFRFPWCLLGYSQADDLAFIQIARFGAVYAVSFVVALASGVLAYVAVEPRAARRRAAVAGLGLVLGGVFLDGWLALARPIEEDGRVRIGLVQASIPQEDKWDQAQALLNLKRHVDLTEQAAAAGARLVIWPESALPFDFDSAPEVAASLRELVATRRLFLIFGNDDREYGREGRTWVGAKMLTPQGELAFRYHKIRLVPFGEYVPLRPILTLGGRVAAKLVQQVSDFTPGDGFSLAQVDGHALATFICYEAIFPDLVREFAARGAGVLVNITNDGWYGRSSAPFQHFAMARFRAVENGKYLVRAANTGITAVVDPRGRVLASTSLFERTLLVRDVPMVRGATFYAERGDLFAFACLGAMLAFTAATLRRKPADS